MPYRRLLTLCLLAVPLVAAGQSAWRDMLGNALPDSDSRKWAGGFGASLIITAEKDWQEKWNTPPESVPHFAEAAEVSQGGELFILTFLANPKVDAARMTDVACDFVVYRPDGSKSANELDMPCFRTELTGDPARVHLSTAWMKYVAEPGDQRGAWTVKVVVKDRLRAVEIPLQASFVVR